MAQNHDGRHYTAGYHRLKSSKAEYDFFRTPQRKGRRQLLQIASMVIVWKLVDLDKGRAYLLTVE
jgi:hypothetical protein